MKNVLETRKLARVIIAMLEDDELYCGGCFQKEKYYMEKYNLTQEEIGNMWCNLYFALNCEETYRK